MRCYICKRKIDEMEAGWGFEKLEPIGGIFEKPFHSECKEPQLEYEEEEEDEWDLSLIP